MAEGVREQGTEDDICNYLRGRKVAVSWRKLDDAESHNKYLSSGKIKENVMVETCGAFE
jgi:hypothetical protein